ncbi:hypothetical protein HK099_008196 [Clydaea vesicula]|uniref:Kinesin-like protein n=1 Tax=Clydaea vesicula TaxID=447962 RepID=A0AAD5XXU2_9FUNG|nr:hypothetical protein HK099_008196 [Clydaea vesicula]
MSNNIKVVCRFRPQNKREIAEGGVPITLFNDDMDTVKLDSKEFPGSYTFDKVFDWKTSQSQLFDYTSAATIADVMKGYNGTIFAYGQTGSGKTHTMMGDMENPEMQGLTPRLVQTIFDTILKAPDTLEFTVKVSFMEIYMEKVKDLLNPVNDNLPIHEEKSKGVYVKGLLEVFVGSVEEVYDAMKRGQENRVVAFTKMNAESSRSHSIFVLHVSQKNLTDGSTRVGKLSLVDLAGSEKIGKTGATGQTLEEAKKINKSLSALGMVINALTDGKSAHIPYRDSKLTRILQESLGGNSKTTLIINCSPSSFNEAETVGTLRFGMRAKTIANKAKVNAELSAGELKVMLKKAKIEISSLRDYAGSLEGELASWRTGASVSQSDWVPLQDHKKIASSKSTEIVESVEVAAKATVAATSLTNDEREEFLKRENELSDLLAEKEAELKKKSSDYLNLKEELTELKEKDGETSTENKALSTEVNDAKLQLEKALFDFKESSITIDSLKESNNELYKEIENLKKYISELESRPEYPTPSASPQPQQDKEQKKQERMAQMMAEFDPSNIILDKEQQMRETLSKLASMDDNTQPPTEAADIEQQHRDLHLIRIQLAQSQQHIQELTLKVKEHEEKSHHLAESKLELEEKLIGLESEYEQLLDRTIIEDEQHASVEMSTAIQDIKSKLEAQFNNKREVQEKEIEELHIALDKKEEENALEALNNANGTSVDGFKKDEEIDKLRKTMAQQLSEFDVMKKKLMRDLQDRCEKIVELELSLDETREQYTSLSSDPERFSKLESSLEETRKKYNTILSNSNSKAQQQKLAFMERNLEQLTNIQKQFVEQNSSLKKELSVSERKLAARNERIQNLETLLHEAQKKIEVQSAKFESQVSQLKSKLDVARSQTPSTSSWLYSSSKIAKPLRGGGATPLSGEDDVNSGSSEVEPLSAIKKNLSASTGKRSSWYVNLLKK